MFTPMIQALKLSQHMFSRCMNVINWVVSFIDVARSHGRYNET